MIQFRHSGCPSSHWRWPLVAFSALHGYDHTFFFRFRQLSQPLLRGVPTIAGHDRVVDVWERKDCRHRLLTSRCHTIGHSTQIHRKLNLNDSPLAKKCRYLEFILVDFTSLQEKSWKFCWNARWRKDWNAGGQDVFLPTRRTGFLVRINVERYLNQAQQFQWMNLVLASSSCLHSKSSISIYMGASTTPVVHTHPP